jgi:hypothetical protein
MHNIRLLRVLYYPIDCVLSDFWWSVRVKIDEKPMQVSYQGTPVLKRMHVN